MIKLQQFKTGATRSADQHKFDYEGFFNPEVLYRYATYMHEHRKQPDGNVRDSDNWQKGIPLTNYIKSLVRHVIDLWRLHRGYKVINPDTNQPHTVDELCCAIMFNSMGYLKEHVSPAIPPKSLSHAAKKRTKSRRWRGKSISGQISHASQTAHKG